MVDLFGRLVARTLTTAPGLRPTGLDWFAPDRGANVDIGEDLVSDVAGMAVAAALQKGDGPGSEPTVIQRGNSPVARESAPPPRTEGRLEEGKSVSGDLSVSVGRERIRETSPQDDLGIDKRVTRSDVWDPKRKKRMEPTQATQERVDTGLTPSVPTVAKPNIGKVARSRPKRREDAPLAEISRSARAIVSEGAHTPHSDAHAKGPRLQREETTVRVSIGRLEVRAPEPPQPEPVPQPWSGGSMLSLDDYLRRRREGSK